jgi:hypothetical protein
MDVSILQEVDTFARRADALILLADQARGLLAQAQQRAQQNDAEAQRLKTVSDDLVKRAQQIVEREKVQEAREQVFNAHASMEAQGD